MFHSARSSLRMTDGLLYATCFGIFHLKCCDNFVNKKGFVLQVISLLQLSIHSWKSAFVACFVQMYCVLHVQLVLHLCWKVFDVRFRSSHQEVMDVSSCATLMIASLTLVRFSRCDCRTSAVSSDMDNFSHSVISAVNSMRMCRL